MKANNLLLEFIGTENYYKHMFGLHYTDGVKEFAERFKAYWFIDLIASYQTNATIANTSLQVWTLKRDSGSKFTAKVQDGDLVFILEQELVSDFEHDEVEIWVADKIIFLPREN